MKTCGQSVSECMIISIFSNLPRHPAEGAAPLLMLQLIPKELVSWSKMMVARYCVLLHLPPDEKYT